MSSSWWLDYSPIKCCKIYHRVCKGNPWYGWCQHFWTHSTIFLAMPRRLNRLCWSIGDLMLLRHMRIPQREVFIACVCALSACSVVLLCGLECLDNFTGLWGRWNHGPFAWSNLVFQWRFLISRGLFLLGWSLHTRNVEFHEVVPVGLAHNTGNIVWGKPLMMYLTVKYIMCVGTAHGRIHRVRRLFRDSNYSLFDVVQPKTPPFSTCHIIWVNNKF